MEHEIDAIRRVLNAYCNKPPVIIEAGCYDGAITKTLLLLTDYQVEKYYAFECDPRSIAKIQANGFPSQATLVCKALGNVDGQVDLHISEGVSSFNFVYDCSSSIRPPKQVKEDWSEIQFNQTYPVICTKLDTFCAENNITHIDLIWADIQGAEKDMVMGGKEIIRQTKFLYLEHSEDREWYEGQWTLPEMVADLKDFGFEVAQKFPCDVLFYNTKLVTR